MEHVDHILIVDDEPEIRERAGNYLRKNGLRTTVVADGRQIRSFLDTTARHLLDEDHTLVALSGAQYRLLRVFLYHPQHVLNRDQLLNLTQGRDADLFDRSIDLLVRRLRQRLLNDAREPACIKTVRSEGNVFSLAMEILEADQ